MRWLPAGLTLTALGLPVVALALLGDLDPGTARPLDGPWCRPLELRRGDAFPRTFANAAGESAIVAAPPRRIASATIFSDVVLLAICPRERIQALCELGKDPNYSSRAVESRAFPRHISSSPEQILAAQPDLVVVSSFSSKDVHNLLSREGCAVLRFVGFSGVGDIQNNIRALGYVLGLDDAAEGLVQAMQRRLERVAQGREARRAWRVLHWAGDGHTSGSGTTFDSLMHWVGARNVAVELGLRSYGTLRVEQVLAQDPDAVVVGVEADGEAGARARLAQVPGFAALSAVRRERIVTVPNAVLLSTAHDVALAAERIAEVLDGWGRP